MHFRHRQTDGQTDWHHGISARCIFNPVLKSICNTLLPYCHTFLFNINNPAKFMDCLSYNSKATDATDGNDHAPVHEWHGVVAYSRL